MKPNKHQIICGEIAYELAVNLMRERNENKLNLLDIYGILEVAKSHIFEQANRKKVAK